jgi:hypothetical protein
MNDMEPTKFFWIVWSSKSLLIAGALKTFECEVEARQHAAQLARLNQGTRYHVMQSKASCVVADLTWTSETP